jgi:hypothetical protein
MNCMYTSGGKSAWLRAGAAKMLRNLAALILAGTATGCHTIRWTEPPRTATEQLLISTAADRALAGADFSWVKGQKVYLEDKYFESYDKGYAVGLIRERLAVEGARLQPAPATADLVVEIRSGALSINTASTLVGIPSAPAPVVVGTIQTPEVSLYKSQRDDSISKIALFAYRRDTGDFVASSGTMAGGARFHIYDLLGVKWKRTDIPELKHPPK